MTDLITKLQNAASNPFIVRGYHRSDGAVVNLQMRFLPSDGYKQLVRDSIELIDKFGELLQGAHYAEARDAVLASLQKTLAEPGEGEEPPKRATHEKLVPMGRHLSLLDADLNNVVIFNMETLDTEVVVEPTRVVKSSDLTIAKKKLMACLPVHRYCHRLNLYPGKFEAVE